MTHRTARSDVLVPLFIAQVPQRTLARKGLNPSHWEQILRQLFKVRVDESSVLDTFISLEQYRQLLLLGKMAFGEGALVQWWSADLQLMQLGPIGLAVTSAGTVEESINVLSRFVPVVYPPMQLNVRTNERDCIVTFDIVHAMPEVENIVVEITMLTALKIFLNLDIPAKDIRIRLQHEAKLEDSHYLENFGRAPTFRQSSNTITIPSRYLRQGNRDASPLVFRQAIRDCQALQEKLISLSSLGTRTYQILLDCARSGTHLSLEEVADRLAMSTRTLIRRLQTEGSSFRDIQSDVRLGLAMEYLEGTDRPIKRIGHDAGFTSLSSFSRAFRKRTGLSPSEYRQQNGRTD